MGERYDSTDIASSQSSTVEALGLNRTKIVLLVISPQADPDQAHAIMMAAAGPNNASTVESLLMIRAEETETRV